MKLLCAKNKILMLSIVLVFTCFLTIHKVEAASPEKTKQLSMSIVNWVIDENLGYIYALTKEGHLLFIRTDTLEVQNDLQLRFSSGLLGEYANGDIRLVLHKDRLYVYTDLGTTPINTITQTMLSPLPVASKLPYITDDKAYDLGDGKLYVTDLKTKQVKIYNIPEIGTVTNGASLAVDEKKGVAYIGVNYGDLFTVRLSDLKVIDKSNFFQQFPSSFKLNNGFMVLDGSDLFVNDRRINPVNLTEIENTYDGFLGIRGNYVYGQGYIYDRETSAEIGTIPFGSHYVLIDDNNIYLFNENQKRLYKYKLEITPLTYVKNSSNAKINTQLNKWIYDGQRDRIYALTSSNQMLVIRCSDLNLLKVVNVGSKPTDLVLYHDRIYVGLNGTSKIPVYDADTVNLVNTYSIQGNAASLSVGLGKIFFFSYEKNYNQPVTKLSAFDLVSRQQQLVTISSSSLTNPRLLIDEKKGILYISQPAGFNSLFTINARTFQVVQQTSSDDNLGQLFLDGNNLYFGSKRLDPNNIGIVKNQYQSILNVLGKYVLTANAIYDRDTAEKAKGLPFEAKLAAMNPSGTLFLYDGSRLYKMASGLLGTVPPSNADLGKIMIQKPIVLWQRVNGKLKAIRTLQPNQSYHVYTFDKQYGGQYGVGGNYWVTNIKGYVSYSTNRLSDYYLTAKNKGPKGEIGYIVIKKPIVLWKRDESNKLYTVRTLLTGSVYRTYIMDDKYGGQYGLGGGYWITNSMEHIVFEPTF